MALHVTFWVIGSRGEEGGGRRNDGNEFCRCLWVLEEKTTSSRYIQKSAFETRSVRRSQQPTILLYRIEKTITISIGNAMRCSRTNKNRKQVDHEGISTDRIALATNKILTFPFLFRSLLLSQSHRLARPVRLHFATRTRPWGARKKWEEVEKIGEEIGWRVCLKSIRGATYIGFMMGTWGRESARAVDTQTRKRVNTLIFWCTSFPGDGIKRKKHKRERENAYFHTFQPSLSLEINGNSSKHEQKKLREGCNYSEFGENSSIDTSWYSGYF